MKDTASGRDLSETFATEAKATEDTWTGCHLPRKREGLGGNGMEGWRWRSSGENVACTTRLIEIRFCDWLSISNLHEE